MRCGLCSREIQPGEDWEPRQWESDTRSAVYGGAHVECPPTEDED